MDLLTVRDIALELFISVQKVRRLIRTGRLPAINTSTGKRPSYLVHREHLQAFLKPVKRENRGI